jgi:hypothetical protein
MTMSCVPVPLVRSVEYMDYTQWWLKRSCPLSHSFREQ